jgi:peptidoglycan/LPS O-acetylase OafA/YrhL
LSSGEAQLRAHTRRRDIQGLRALAILFVVAYHGGLHTPGGFTGVDVFFVISGYVISGTLVAELRRTGRIDLPAFYARRVRRLLPALATMIIVVVVLNTILGALGPTQQLAERTGLFAAVFAANAYLAHIPTGYFDPAVTTNPFLHTWSLAVEEQFYFVFPALLLCAWRLRRRLATTTAAAVAIGVVSTLSLLLALTLSAGPPGGATRAEHFAFYSSPTRAWEFGAGALVFLAGARVRRAAAFAGAAIGLAAVLATLWLVHDTSRDPGLWTLLPVAGTCALLFTGTTPTRISTTLGSQPLVRIGDLSYSWYLWHWPLIVFAGTMWPSSRTATVCAAVGSIVPAWISFTFVENPIRFAGGLTLARTAAAGAVCVVVPLAVAHESVRLGARIDRASRLATWQQAQEIPSNCTSFTPFADPSCSAPLAHARGTVVLLGDSNAGQFTGPFVVAAHQAGYTALVGSTGGCPLANVGVVGLYGEEACRTFNTSSLQAIARRRPALVIVSNRVDTYVHGTSVGLRSAPSGPIERRTAKKAGILARGLGSTLATIERDGVPVLLIRPIPVVPWVSPNCAALRILLRGCASSVSRRRADSELGQTRMVDDRALRLAPGAVPVDFESALCSRTRCSSQRGGLIIYRDQDHLSLAGAATLTTRFYRLIESHARR